jgi:tetratricopeptide (TPR) repeat protein
MNRYFVQKSSTVKLGLLLALLGGGAASAAPSKNTPAKSTVQSRPLKKTTAEPMIKPTPARARAVTPATSAASETPQVKESAASDDKPQKEINPQQWILRLPAVAKEKKQWRDLITGLIDLGMDYGAVMASARMLIFFEDIESKEFAFRTIIEQVDNAWPYAIRELFIPGDINPASADSFAHSYNLYKALLSESSGMNHWAKTYYGRIDREKSPKYLFHTALQKYQAGEVDEAVRLLREILGMNLESNYAYLETKAARTLARIYYEKERYTESLDVYENLLLKLNPVVPTDWLEAAWNLYRLKRYTKALGYVYNLESMRSGAHNNIERYVLRAVIYRDNCDTPRMNALSQAFNDDHEEVIDGIRSGLELGKFPILHELNIPENTEYSATFFKLRGLEKELGRIDNLPASLRQLAQYLYKSEITAHEVYLKLHRDEALQHSASRIFTVSEALKFLSFDVAREKFNPNAVFEERKIEREIFSERSLLYPERQLKWRQFDDFWRDERKSYLVGVKNRCAE